MKRVREADHKASESSRVTDNKMYKLTTFRLNNSASLTCGESELKYFNFLFHYLKQLLPLFEGLGQVKKSSDLKPTQVLSCSTTRN